METKEFKQSKKIFRMRYLITFLNNLRDAYYNKNKSIVSDREYDELYDELEQLELETHIIYPNSPTQTVGYEVVSELPKVKHSHPMLSLQKTKSVNDLAKFINGQECILSAKLDGLTVLLTYDNGKLVKAETRGNGEVGEDITHNAKVFKNVPLNIEYPYHLEVEGEAIITYDDLKEINANLPEAERFKNPRNLVSGSVRQLDSKITSQRNIRFVAWKLPFGYSTFSDGFDFLENQGFDVVPCTYVNSTDITKIEDVINEVKMESKTMSYPIDGLVLTYNNTAYGQSLGMTGHHPKHSIAYKFYDEVVETTIQDVEWTVGQSGVITPTAVFEPIEIDGTEVSRASLHNVSIFESFNLYRGDMITVYKANQIIPQISENIDKDKPYKSENLKFQIPNFCPICGEKTINVGNSGTLYLYCANPYCIGKFLSKVSRFVSKDCMNIKGLSESTLEKFIKKDWICSFVDVYHLKDHMKEIEQLDGFGFQSTSALLYAIEQSRVTTLDKFINALCIPNVGKETAKLIAKDCKYDIEMFLYRLSEDYNWSNIDSIGYTILDSIIEFYEYNKDDIDALVNELQFETPEISNVQSLQGMIFCITGSLNHFNNRDEVKEMIESLGGKVSGSVSNKTNYLVNNDINSASSKNKKAKELNIPIITENELIDMLNSNK